MNSHAAGYWMARDEQNAEVDHQRRMARRAQQSADFWEREANRWQWQATESAREVLDLRARVDRASELLASFSASQELMMAEIERLQRQLTQAQDKAPSLSR
jgi:hypothetical protein